MSEKESLVSQYFNFKKKSRSKSQNNSSSSPTPGIKVTKGKAKSTTTVTTTSSSSSSPTTITSNTTTRSSSANKYNDQRTKPLVWSGKSQDDLYEWKLASPLYSTPILSSISGPNGGLTRARALSKPLTLRDDDQFMFIDDEVDESNYNCYDGNKNKLDQRLASNFSTMYNRGNNNNLHLHPPPPPPLSPTCTAFPPSVNGNCSSNNYNKYNNVNSNHINKLPLESPDPPELPPKRSSLNKFTSSDTSKRQTPPQSLASTSFSSQLPYSLQRKPLPLPPESLVNSVDVIAGSSSWGDCVPQFAYGISESLYERHPITGAQAGEPIADCYALSVRSNSAIIAIADGVNWGTGSALAATCAIRGAMEYLNKAIYHGINGTSGVTNTKEIAISLLRSMTAAHTLILSDENASQTTLTVGVTAQLADSNKWVLVTCNVGDSFGYVFSPKHGVREVTEGSHNIHVNRNMNDTCGALGPVIGNDPVLDNLTIAMTLVDEGDVIIFASDGISDNFDPVVGDRALAAGSATAERYLKRLSSVNSSNVSSSTVNESTSKNKNESSASGGDSVRKNNKNPAKNQLYHETIFNSTSEKKKSNLLTASQSNNKSNKNTFNFNLTSHKDSAAAATRATRNDSQEEERSHNGQNIQNIQNKGKPLPSVLLVTAKERHEMTLSRMERVISSRIRADQQVTAQGVAEALFNYAKDLTVEKRSLIERKELYNLTDDGIDDFTHLCQKERRKKAGRNFWNAPGKLDHASVVTFKVGTRTTAALTTTTDGTKDESTIW